MADTLREFLVGLGFKIDDNSYNKFLVGVERASAQVTRLGAEMVETALAIQVGVSKIAKNFEDLYYASQRTRSSVASLQSFEFAARNIGLTSDQARSAVEGMARAMRSNPGIGALLNQLGIKTQGRETTQILDDTVDRLARMPFYLAQQYAALAGIDGDALLQMINNRKKLRDEEIADREAQRQAGVNVGELAKKSTEYNTALRHLERTLDLIGDRIFSSFVGPFTEAIKKLDDWLKTFIEFDKATNGWATTLGTVATSALGVYIAKLILMKTLFRGIAAEAGAAATAAAGLGGAGGAAGAVSGGLAARLRGAVARALLGRGGGVMGLALEVMLGMKADDAAGNPVRSWLRNKLGIDDTHEDPKYREKRGAVVDYFQKQGWTREQAAGIAANLEWESRYSAKAVGDQGQAYGLAQWHPDRQAAFRAWAGKDIRESTMEEQLAFVQHELETSERRAGDFIRSSKTARQASTYMNNLYERSADDPDRVQLRGDIAESIAGARLGSDRPLTPAPVINQKTDIHVESPDPGVAASKTAEAQGRVNADIVRNLGAVTR